MARIAQSRFPDKLKKALKEELPSATVEAEKISGTDRYAFLVVSEKFRKMSPAKRQNLVWGIVDKSLTADDMLRISTILPLVPDELKKS